jgi:hypothetical protein
MKDGNVQGRSFHVKIFLVQLSIATVSFVDLEAYNSVNVTRIFLLQPFVQELTSNRSSTVVLTYDEVTFFAWAGLQSSDGLMWCWSSLLWGRINQTILTSKNGFVPSQ